MIVFLNGKFVPEERAVVSIFDRGFLYGDGLFEGMLVVDGHPFRWNEHMCRLQRGVDFLKLTVPYSWDELRQYAQRLIKRNKMTNCMLRLSLSRGITGRTYSPKNAKSPAVVMTLHPTPPVPKMFQWRVVISSFRLPSNDPLSAFKTANKLSQVLARAGADAAEAQEAILLNAAGRLAEGTTSNLFWIKKGVIYTPALPDGPLPGVTRAAIMELCVKMNIGCKEKKARPAELLQSDGAFLTMTSMGVVEIVSVNGRKLRQSPLTPRLWTEYQRLLKAG